MEKSQHSCAIPATFAGGGLISPVRWTAGKRSNRAIVAIVATAARMSEAMSGNVFAVARYASPMRILRPGASLKRVK
jgi:hypothetical protein